MVFDVVFIKITKCVINEKLRGIVQFLLIFFIFRQELRSSPAEDLGDAAVGHLQDAGDVARSGSRVRQLHDLLSRGVWQGPPAHEHAAQLVHAAVPCNKRFLQTSIRGLTLPEGQLGRQGRGALTMTTLRKG